jgi:hypothetical protein
LSYLLCDCFVWCCFISVFVQSCLIFRLSMVFVLISGHGTVFILFIFADLLRLKFSADSMTLLSSTFQIRMHDYSGHLNLVISIWMINIIFFVTKKFDWCEMDPCHFIFSHDFSIFTPPLWINFSIFYKFQYYPFFIF